LAVLSALAPVASWMPMAVAGRPLYATAGPASFGPSFSSVMTRSTFTTPEQFGAILLKVMPDGSQGRSSCCIGDSTFRH
jgi:hypothetical protein